MEYSYENFTKAIYYFLTIHPNKKYNGDEIIKGIIEENICPELTTKPNTRSNYKYMMECFDEIESYDGIYIDEADSENPIDDYYMFETKNNDVFDMKEIEKIINSPNIYPNYQLYTTYQNNQTILHILCIERRLDLLNKVCDMYNIDFMTKNDNGDTLIDVASYVAINKNDLNFLKQFICLMLRHNGEMIDNNIYEIKKKNIELLDLNYKLQKDVNDFKISLNEIEQKYSRLVSYVMNILMIFIFSVFVRYLLL